MRVVLNTGSLEKKLDNLVDYSIGFLEGAESGKKIFLDNLGKGTVEALKLYIDAMARSNPQSLHHVYEWYRTGNRDGRLFDVQYRITNIGLSLESNFRQSSSVQSGSSQPFYNKAKIMEDGVPVVIKPRGNNPLVFQDNGVTVYTKKTIVNQFPGGKDVQGSYESTFDSFITNYFAQSFLTASGLYDYFSNPKIYKTNFVAGINGGKAVGQSTGFRWITNAKLEVE
jgi:hypothetical protein